MFKSAAPWVLQVCKCLQVLALADLGLWYVPVQTQLPLSNFPVWS
jgi:hypothetical protein